VGDGNGFSMMRRLYHLLPRILRDDFLCYNIEMGRNYSDLLEKSMDASRLELLHLLAYHASMLQMPLYLVGGVVRDILLEYPVREFDLVVEGDGAVFAEYIVKKIGGRVLVHSKFKTATWTINESTLKRLDFPAFQQRDFSLSFDLVSARSETYASPGALPTVKRSTIEDDMRRRDFTINAMALRLDGDHFGELVDVLDGRSDLKGGVIRALHPKSFIDDPTRMFRAVRYAERYGFKIEPETMKYFNEDAKAVMRDLSGERLRHEVDLIFDEARRVSMLKRVNELGLLTVVHPAFSSFEPKRLTALKMEPAKGFGEFTVPDILSFTQTLGWILLLIDHSEKDVEEIAERLAFPVQLTKATRGAASLRGDLPSFKDWKPSQWTFHLDKYPALSVYALWVVTSEEHLHEYLETWQKIKPFTSGDDLKDIGLEPGPKYKEILSRLRAAWLDEEVNTEKEEINLRNRLIAE
jgi:tRNA nucleotidyltransferase (CCA-adding enzyme)